MPRTIGLMSGTSLDGVDAAWLDTDGVSINAFGPAVTVTYDDALRRDLRAVLDLAPVLAPYDPRLSGLVARLTNYHVRAVEKLRRSAELVGFHGQTILHQPDRRRTWQIGDAAGLAARLGVPVVYDFRSANVTWLGQDGSLLAFDTGPGNGPLDDWVFQHTGQAFDADGALAKAGRVDQIVLGRLMAHPYFGVPAPKSLDRLDFGRALAASGLAGLSAAGGAATLVAFTVASVAAAVFPERPERWLVSGGGRMNPVVMAGLRAALGVPVEPVEVAGWNGDALEAQCFGFLAARVVAGLPLSLPSTTGVPRPMSGGRIAALD
jgi:anhydro-N-acetylmuramic acid kinase